MSAQSAVAFSAVLRLEWDKVRRSIANLVALAVLLLGTAGMVALYSWVGGSVATVGVDSRELLTFAVVKGSLAPAGASLLGAWLGGAEVRSRTWALTLLRVPKRPVALGAKLTVVTAGGGAVALLAVAVATGAVVLVLGPDVVTAAPAGVVRLAAVHVVVTAAWGALGCALAVVMRSGIGAMGVLVGLAVVVEPALQAVAASVGGALTGAVQLLPHALTTSAQLPDLEQLALFGPSAAGVHAAAAAAALVGYAVLVVVLGHRRFAAQDV